MRVLVTGAAGMLGRDLVPLLESAGHTVTATDLDVDVTDQAAVAAAVGAARPDSVFHLAAWTDVDGAESREDDALAVNRDGCRHVAEACHEAGIPLICVSTDYVFDGTAQEPYVEDSPPNPLNAYGRTKLAGERAALTAHPSGTRIARTAWLYGAFGRNFVDTMRRLGREQPTIRVVDDQVGCPTWTGDLAPALVDLLDRPPGVYHLAGAGAVSWAGLAEAVFSEAGIACAVQRIPTEQMPRPARRPMNTALAVTRPDAPVLRPWRDALHDYIREYPAP